MSRVDLGPLGDLPDGAPVPRSVEGLALVVVRVGDRVFALEDRCSHEEFPLSAGEVDAERCEIECERHGAMFRLDDGAAASLPATRSVPSYPVTVSDGRVWVETP